MRIQHPIGLRESAAETAVAALAFLAEDPRRISAFLDPTGLEADALRGRVADPAFLAAILDYLAGDEAMLLDFSRQVGCRPEDVERARAVLAGPRWERDMP